MKRVCLLVLVFIQLLCLFCFAEADQLSPSATGRINIRCNLSMNGNNIVGYVNASVQAGMTMSLTATLQYKTEAGVWRAKSTATGSGGIPVTVTCAASSGTSYRIKYTYNLYNNLHELEESGSGYSSVFQTP